MAANQPEWPRRWLMTDERLGDRLWRAIDALPEGAGIIFRHYSLPESTRLALGRKVAEVAADRGLLLGVAGNRALAGTLGAALVHNPGCRGDLPFSMAVHDERQALDASESEASLAFVAPVCPTRSHPDAIALGWAESARLAGLCGCPAIALGGMNERNFAELEAAHPGAFHGYAGIDCWLDD